MNNVRILDCTLRDGGRIINCDFGGACINNILNGLQEAQVDIIELGFIRNNIIYKEGSTFFTDFEQLKRYIEDKPAAEIVLFADYGMFEASKLPVRNEDNPVTGIRLGFTKGNFDNAMEDMTVIQEKGYRLYIQDVDTLGYSDDEIMEMIYKVNKIKPYSFAIVDTYGAMYREDVLHYYELFDKNLEKDTAIDFHSHNNYQLSFSLAQEIIRLAEDNPSRNVIIDATLYGMGKGAGNLNTELLVEYLNRKKKCDYGLSILFDTIDENIMRLHDKLHWGYSANSLLSGIYKAHPNNVIYLTEKFKLDTNDIENILAMIDADMRKTYDYDNIEKCYIEYNSARENDEEAKLKLKYALQGKDILVIAPGSSINIHGDLIKNFIKCSNPAIISVNFEYLTEEFSYAFFASQKRYKQYKAVNSNVKVIITSNVKPKTNKEYCIDYKTIVKRGWRNFDNATIMLLRFLKDIDISSINIAGFDGFGNGMDNFGDKEMETGSHNRNYDRTNGEIYAMFYEVRKEYAEKGVPVSFLTTSIYDVENQ